MTEHPTANIRLLTRASDHRCQNCPPDRVCAWGCIQGAGMMDIVIGAGLVLDGRDRLPEPGAATGQNALMQAYNAPGE
ncbi:MAG: hypothetical protein JW910_16795 [Anaerolineae bacterium]|nr:hypothetical protein [Anaerolineae bacterium]